MKRLLLSLLFATCLHAEQVFMSMHGKTFHTSRTCMALSHSKAVYAADDSVATAHGLKPCGICAHRHSATPKKAKAGNGAFAQEVK